MSHLQKNLLIFLRELDKNNNKPRFAWTGYLDKPLTYQVNGKLSDFGSNASEAVPGVSGFTGTIEGNDRGGKFVVASKNLQIDVPRIMRAPLQFTQFDSGGS